MKDLISFEELIRRTRHIRRVPVDIWGEMSFNPGITAGRIPFQWKLSEIETLRRKGWEVVWEEVN